MSPDVGNMTILERAATSAVNDCFHNCEAELKLVFAGEVKCLINKSVSEFDLGTTIKGTRAVHKMTYWNKQIASISDVYAYIKITLCWSVLGFRWIGRCMFHTTVTVNG
jgi:hypothetical protein